MEEGAKGRCERGEVEGGVVEEAVERTKRRWRVVKGSGVEIYRSGQERVET